MNIFEAAKKSKDGKVTVKDYVDESVYFNIYTMSWECGESQLRIIYPKLSLHEMNLQTWEPYKNIPETSVEFELTMICRPDNVYCFTTPEKIDVYRVLGLIEIVKNMYVRHALNIKKGEGSNDK